MVLKDIQVMFLVGVLVAVFLHLCWSSCICSGTDFVLLFFTELVVLVLPVVLVKAGVSYEL